ncbi:required for meiotic nuclear division protein 1 homolog [Atheta coriaria]|uniref:required for meiotic nuclear division protein 1 homolog n=1 Tax=Dalotia coriaria TaxID=877792 RepID=UPI0031F373BA
MSIFAKILLKPQFMFITCCNTLRFNVKSSLVRNLHAKTAIQENISALQLKKRPLRKKRALEEEQTALKPGTYNVLAYSTAEEYDLEALIEGLKVEGLYEPKNIDNHTDCVHAVAKYKVETEPREIFFFREGSLVMWNMTDLESHNLLAFINKYEQDRYAAVMVHREAEYMNYTHHQVENKLSTLDGSCDIVLSKDDPKRMILDKYTFSNAMALSVKLGIWEASLERYVDSIEGVTEDLKLGRKLQMSREEVLRKHGELFALRHVINLSSDLLDVPDFYWEREHLEQLYQQMCNYFSITRRTRVLNEKINHCVELIELVSSHLSDKHHIRLEWMIIVLIMVEVGFEMIHYADRYLA